MAVNNNSTAGQRAMQALTAASGGGSRQTASQGHSAAGTGGGKTTAGQRAIRAIGLTPWQPEQQEQDAGGFTNSIQAVTPGQQTMSAQQDAQMQRQQAEQAAAMRAQQEQQEQARQAQEEQQRQARENYDRYMAEAQRLSQEREANTQIYADGIYMGEDKKAAAAYDRRISEARQKADAELAKLQPVSSGKRDRLLDEYNSAAEAERQAAIFAYDPIATNDLKEATERRRELEKQVEEENRNLGNKTYEGLAANSRNRDFMESTLGKRETELKANVGNTMEWLGSAPTEAEIAEYDMLNGGGAFERDTAGRPTAAQDFLREKGSDLFRNSQEDYRKYQEQGETSRSDTSGIGRLAMDTGEAAINVGLDMVDNMIVPGAGTLRMYMGAGGQGALTQADRENNDVNARMLKSVTDMATAWLSTRLLGGMESVYGKSVLGRGIEQAVSNASPAVQKAVKTLLNTEGVEEGLEYALGYAADRILALDPEAQFKWGEAGQNALVGYILGVITNGLAGGINYGAKRLRNVVDEGMEVVNADIPVDDAIRQAQETVKEDVVMKAPPPEAETQTGTTAPQGQTQAQTQAQTDVIAILMNPNGEGGRLSNSQVNTIANNADLLQAFQELTGTSPEGTTSSELRNSMKEAGAQWLADQRNAGAEAPQGAGEPQGGNIPPETADANNGGLTGQIQNAEGNPSTAGGPPPLSGEAGAQAGAQAGQNVPPAGAPASTGSGPERTSQFYANTLTQDEGDRVRDPLTYLGKSDAETLQNTMNRLGMNGEAEMATLMSSEMWNDEQVQMARIIRESLFADAQKTGDYVAYDAWRKVSDEHHRVIARALRQVGVRNDVSTESIATMAHSLLDNISADIAENGKSRTVGKVTQEDVARTRQAVDETIGALGGLEAEEAEMRKAGASEEEIWEKVKDRYLDLAQKTVAERNMGTLWDNALGRNKALREGKSDVQTRLRGMLSKMSPEYIRNYARANAAGQAADIAYMGRPTAKQAASMVSGFQKLCQLFGSGTTLRNTESNVIFGTLDWASNNTGGVLADSVISLLTGNRTRGLEAGMAGGANLRAAMDAARQSVLEIAANMDMTEDGKYISGTQSFSPYNPGTRFIARLNQILSYALNTTDAAAVGLHKTSAGNAAMRAGGKSGMTAETAERIGQQEADFRTFKDKNAVTENLTKVQQMLDLIGFGGEVQRTESGVPTGRKGGFGLGTAIQPYIGVPTNIKLKPLQYSPVGAAVGIYNAGKAVSEARNAPKGSQAAQDAMVLQNKASGQIGRGLTGTAALIALKALMKQAKDEDREWFKDWSLETDPDVKAQNRAEGKSGQQVNLSLIQRLRNGEKGGWQNGDELVDISSNEPLNAFLSLASIMAEDEDASTPEAYFSALVRHEEESLTDLPCLEAINSFASTYRNSKVYDTTVTTDAEGNETESQEINNLKTFGNALGAMGGSAASGFIPAPVRHAAAAADEYQRDTRGGSAMETAWNQVLNAIPGEHGRESLPVKTDAFGNELTQGNAGTRLANTYLANKYSQVNQSDVSAEMERLRESTGDVLIPARSGPKSVQYGSGDSRKKVELSAGESQEYKNSLGRDYETQARDLMQTETYRRADDTTKTAMLAELEKFAKDTAKTNLAEDRGIDFESGYENIRDLDDPAEYLGIRTGFRTDLKDQDWNAVDMLVQSAMKNLSASDREYLRDHGPDGYGLIFDMAQAGVGSKTVNQYQNDLREVYTAEKRTAPNGYDIFRVIANGNYAPEEADAFMSREDHTSQETVDRWKERVAYDMEQSGYPGAGEQVWQMVESYAAGDLTKDQLEKNLGQLPARWQKDIKDIASDYAATDYAAGKNRHAVYNAVRGQGYTPDVALQFWEMLDTNWSGTVTKKELRKAIGAFPEPYRSAIRQEITDALW